MADVFISYKREDRDQVAHFARALEAEGISVWWDPELPLGQSYSSSIHTQINSAKVVIPVWTARSVTSEWVQEEATQGKKMGLLIPVRLEAVEPPIGFGMVQTADLADWKSGDRAHPEFRRLIEHVRAKIEGRAAKELPAAPAALKAKNRPAGGGRTPMWVLFGFPALLAAIGVYFVLTRPPPNAQQAAINAGAGVPTGQAAPTLPFGLGGNGAGGAPEAAKDSGQAPAAAGANATILDPRALKVGQADTGEIYTTQDTRFYRFDNAFKVRDRVKVRLENLSTTLRPDLKIYDANKSSIAEPYDGNAGASLDYELTIEPGASFYVQVLPYGSMGKYKLSAVAQKAFDQYEPNDDKLATPPIRAGQQLTASIMDNKDEDWFKISGFSKPTVNVTFENQSTTLRPDLKLYDANKSLITEKYDGNPGANLKFEQPLSTQGDLYIQVLPYGSTGKYTLKVE